MNTARHRVKDGAGNQTVSGNATFTTQAAPTGTITEEWGDTLTSHHPNTVEDTYINIDATNSSQATTLNTYTWPVNQPANAVLVKWDLSAIPVGSVIQSATLHLYLEVLEGSGGKSAYDLSVHKIVNNNPIIAQVTGFTYDGTNPWTADGCCFINIPLAQGDIAAAEDVQAIDKTNGYKSWTVTQMIQDWVDNSSTNFGMLINSDTVAAADSNRMFSSSQHAKASQRPKLIITYTLPGTVPNSPTNLVVQ